MQSSKEVTEKKSISNPLDDELAQVQCIQNNCPSELASHHDDPSSNSNNNFPPNLDCETSNLDACLADEDVNGEQPHDKLEEKHQQPIAQVVTTSVILSRGYYDAEKCRAHIANQIRVSKIDRFAAQVGKAIEVEAGFQLRLANILNMFLKCSAQVVHKFTLRCQLGLKRHRQDRILNHSHNHQQTTKRGRPRNNASAPRSKAKKVTAAHMLSSHELTTPLSNDLFYGQGAQMVTELLDQSMRLIEPKMQMESSSINHSGNINKVNDRLDTRLQSYLDHVDLGSSLYVDKLGTLIRSNESQSILLMSQLTTIKQLFERFATEHRDKVDLVYAAEEERQATTVVRRSAYNLSIAAIKATSTPVHVNLGNPSQSAYEDN